MNTINKIASFALVFAPLLEPYVVPGTSVNLDVAFLFITSIVCFIFGKKHDFSLPYKLFPFIIYALLIPFVGLLYFSKATGLISSWYSTILYALNIMFIIPYVRLEYAVKYLKYIVLAAGIVLVIQEIMYNIRGYRFSALIPFLPIKYDGTSISAFMQAQATRARSASFFLEPAHMAQYLMAYLAVILGNNVIRNKLFSKQMIFVLALLLLTWSGTAIMVTSLIIVCYLLLSHISKLKKIFAICVIMVAGVFTIGTTKGMELLSRSQELTFDGSQRVSSGVIRIYRGFYVIGDMPTPQLLTGVGSGYCPNVIDQSDSLWMFYDFERYLNNAQELIVAYGILGTILFLLHLFYLSRGGIIHVKFLLFVFIGLCFLEQFWLGPKMFLLLGLCVAYRNKYLV